MLELDLAVYSLLLPIASPVRVLILEYDVLHVADRLLVDISDLFLALADLLCSSVARQQLHSINR